MPRIFRVIHDRALINRMGFNNPGAQAVAQQLAQWRSSGLWPAHPVGLNLGKSKSTPLEQAAGDYCRSLEVLWPYADFFVVNVSSPNTPNLRRLQDKDRLKEILWALSQTQHDQAAQNSPAPDKPVLVKVSPDLSWNALDEMLELVEPCSIAGLVATNTTLSRPENVTHDSLYTQEGGLSGMPLRQKSTAVIAHLFKQSHGKIPVIGVGGIFTAADAWEKIIAGASLLQVYTGFIYEGPALAKTIVQGLRAKLRRHGLQNLSDAVGFTSNR